MHSKRALNSAHHRYKMMNYVLVQCRRKSFEDVHVKDICKYAGLSKVTFFKYFLEKDDMLVFYKSLLTIGMNIKVQENELSGKKALDAIVAYYISEFRERPSLILGMVSQLISGPSPYKPMRVTAAEKEVFYPKVNFDDIQLLSLDQLVEKCLLESILSAQIKSTGDSKALKNSFLSALYGATVISHVSGDGSDRPLFQNTIRDFQRNLF